FFRFPCWEMSPLLREGRSAAATQELIRRGGGMPMSYRAGRRRVRAPLSATPRHARAVPLISGWTAHYIEGPSLFCATTVGGPLSSNGRKVVVEIELAETDRLDWALKQFRRRMIRSGMFKDMRRKR